MKPYIDLNKSELETALIKHFADHSVKKIGALQTFIDRPGYDFDILEDGVVNFVIPVYIWKDIRAKSSDKEGFITALLAKVADFYGVPTKRLSA